MIYISEHETTKACYQREISTPRDETESVTSTTGDVSDEHVLDADETVQETDTHGKTIL